MISEGEWGRLIGEMGFLMGLMVILVRLGLILKFIIRGYRQLAYDNLLPWILVSFGLSSITQGQWAQPTSLGFCVLVGGLISGACNTGRNAIAKEAH
jgi:hypothetical protein